MRVKYRSRRLGIFGVFIVAPISVSAWTTLDGCSNDSFGVSGADAATSDVSTSDASADVVVTPFDGGACDLSKPFQAFAPITELNAANTQQETARLTHDELNIYFQRQASFVFGSDAGGGDGGSDAGPGPLFQLMTASRAKITDTWGTPTPVGGLSNATASETDPSVAPDNDTLYFGSTMSGGRGASDLWETTRAMPTTTFGTPTTVSGLDTVNDESQPYLMPNGLALYFRTKIVDAGTDFDLAHATRASTTPFALDTSNIFQNVNTANLEALATVTFDELTLYFTSDRAEAGAGGRQIYKATRASTSDPFGAPVAVTELNTIAFIEPSWISDDGCRLYVTTEIAGSFQLNVASKPPN